MFLLRLVLILSCLLMQNMALADNSCAHSLRGEVNSSEPLVDFSPRVRKHVVEFLKRQLDYDPQTLREMIALVDNNRKNWIKEGTKISLSVLSDLRRFLETNHVEKILSRSMHGKNRLKRRIDELRNFVLSLEIHDGEHAFDSSATILDVGAGNGQIVSGLARALGVKSEKVYALELAEYPNRATDVNWIGYNKENKIPLADESVDIITIMMVFHHAPNPQHLISEVFRVLRPGGQIIIRETDAGDQISLGLKSNEVISLNQILDNMLYVVFDPNSGVPMMNNYQPAAYWEKLFADAGFKVERFKTNEPGSPFQPVYFHLIKP